MRFEELFKTHQYFRNMFIWVAREYCIFRNFCDAVEMPPGNKRSKHSHAVQTSVQKLRMIDSPLEFDLPDSSDSSSSSDDDSTILMNSNVYKHSPCVIAKGLLLDTKGFRVFWKSVVNGSKLIGIEMQTERFLKLKRCAWMMRVLYWITSLTFNVRSWKIGYAKRLSHLVIYAFSTRNFIVNLRRLSYIGEHRNVFAEQIVITLWTISVVLSLSRFNLCR